MWPQLCCSSLIEVCVVVRIVFVQTVKKILSYIPEVFLFMEFMVNLGASGERLPFSASIIFMKVPKCIFYDEGT